MEEGRFSQLPPTVFAPSGRLHMVERVMRECSDINDKSAPLAMALKCGGGGNSDDDDDDDDDGGFIVMVSTRPVSPFAPSVPSSSSYDGAYSAPLLTEEQYNEGTMSILTPSLISATGGNAVEAIVLSRRIQEMALSIQASNGVTGVMNRAFSIDSFVLAKQLADAAQSSTQAVNGKAGRMLSSSALIIGVDSPIMTTPKSNIWRVDPTGQFWNCNAAAVGRGAGTAEAIFMRRVATWKHNLHHNDNHHHHHHHQREEENMEDVMSRLSNKDVASFLNTFSVEEALSLVYQCIHETLSTTISTTKTNNKAQTSLANAEPFPTTDSDPWKTTIQGVIINAQHHQTTNHTTITEKTFQRHHQPPLLQILSAAKLNTLVGKHTRFSKS
eukprot:CAMPEP_0195509578 /NCGR_PEP_ID=MMETSP0794_2-20130614/2476_1 /TAXON_ID=515487 /ORGANISM="Stephanopyxis turris, Strain CCMP 815" /LENGTH=384 /DNA_ID=CAMNT_0040636837 /DNA_START=156 /DNA_END=1310 /DNA_ORIENTATION=-